MRLPNIQTLTRTEAMHSASFVLFFVLVPIEICTAQPAEPQLEELVTTGERSIRSMRLEMEAAEEEVFDLFNDIYAGTDYKMICTRERPAKNPLNPIPNSWPVRICSSHYAHELRAEQQEDYAEYVEDIGGPIDIGYFEQETKQHNEELYQRVRDLLVESPEYREKFRNYSRLKAGYSSARSPKCCLNQIRFHDCTRSSKLINLTWWEASVLARHPYAQHGGISQHPHAQQ